MFEVCLHPSIPTLDAVAQNLGWIIDMEGRYLLAMHL